MQYTFAMVPGEERRREPRFLCSGSAHIIDALALNSINGIADICPSGQFVRVYYPLTPGSMIELRHEEHVCRGQIRYPIPDAADRRIGVQLIPLEQWDSQQAWPMLSAKNRRVPVETS